MPRYEFLCDKCQKTFELIMTISEHEKENVRCPTCKSTRVSPHSASLRRRRRRRADIGAEGS